MVKIVYVSTPELMLSKGRSEVTRTVKILSPRKPITLAVTSGRENSFHFVKQPTTKAGSAVMIRLTPVVTSMKVCPCRSWMAALSRNSQPQSVSSTTSNARLGRSSLKMGRDGTASSWYKTWSLPLAPGILAYQSATVKWLYSTGAARSPLRQIRYLHCQDHSRK